jgi:glycosyltransferase involved in cell wall biosynthesis
MHRALADKASLGVVMLQDTYYNRYLTCPVKALDYLSHGIPTIGSDLPSVREVLGHAGTYVDAGDVAGFVHSVKRLLDDPGHYEKMTSFCLQRAEEISWENRARHIVEFVRNH